jgi:SAM-dependent methyltransferase
MPQARDAAARLEDALGLLYAQRFPARERASRARLWRTLYDAFFARYVPADATVLDVGAGLCELINSVRAARRIAVDLNPATAQAAAPGVEVHTLALDALGEAVEPETVDVAFASNVLEHLPGPDALLEVLGALREALRPGGILVVMQPNVRLVGGRFWDFFDHTLPLTERGMAEALRLSGFELEVCRARFLPYTTRSHWPRWAPLVRLYLALRPAQWLFGKQMLLVARRPRSR